VLQEVLDGDVLEPRVVRSSARGRLELKKILQFVPECERAGLLTVHRGRSWRAWHTEWRALRARMDHGADMADMEIIEFVDRDSCDQGFCGTTVVDGVVGLTLALRRDCRPAADAENRSRFDADRGHHADLRAAGSDRAPLLTGTFPARPLV
jgi:hypothetical protein